MRSDPTPMPSSLFDALVEEYARKFATGDTDTPAPIDPTAERSPRPKFEPAPPRRQGPAGGSL